MEQQKDWHTLTLKPDTGEMIKPAETIDIVGREGLTLQDQRIWNDLIANAFGPNMSEDDRDFRIDLTPLRASHKSNERVEDSIERLMKTIARCHLSDGSVTRFQLLGGNNMGDPTRPRGELTYSFDRRLVAVLRNSVKFGKLELAVMAAFSSKYALALYEHVSRRVNLSHMWMQEYEIDELREVLGVQDGTLKAFGNFKQRALVPALKEVNHWAKFRVTATYKKTGQRVTKIVLHWHYKDREGRALAQSQLIQTRENRKASLKDIKETVVILQAEAITAAPDNDLFGNNYESSEI